MSSQVLKLSGTFDTDFRVGNRTVSIPRRQALGQVEAPQDRLVDRLAAFPGISQEEAESFVRDLELTVASSASNAARSATKKVVHRGLIISAGISALTVALNFLATR